MSPLGLVVGGQIRAGGVFGPTPVAFQQMLAQLLMVDMSHIPTLIEVGVIDGLGLATEEE